jgi:2,5-furandicarboxylate decarboxylase 1
MPKDLSGFLRQLRELYPGEAVEVSRTVDPQKHQATAILEHLDLQNRFPVVHFTSARNLLGEESVCSLVSNVFGTRERCATALGFTGNGCNMPLSLEFARLEQQPVPPEIVPKGAAPVKDAVAVGEKADLRELPIVRHFEMDVAPYTTMACIMRDPDDGFYDVSFVKWMYKGPRKAGVVLHSPHFSRLLEKYEKRGQTAPIVNVLGHHPAFYLGSLALSPWGADDYEVIGSFLGEPLRLTPSETWGSDFLVPADAEIVVEGEMPPGVREIVNPFGEYTRTYQAQTLRPVARVTAVTRRYQAVYQDVFSGHRGHFILGGLPKEGSIYNAIQKNLGGVEGVHLPYSGSSRSLCYVSLKTRDPSDVRVAAVQALEMASQIRTVVVVDDDVDVFNEADVLWAVTTWANPRRDFALVEIPPRPGTSKPRQRIVVDATRPRNVAAPSRIKVPDRAMAEVKLEEWIEQRGR